jgi:hypothetical protein
MQPRECCLSSNATARAIAGCHGSTYRASTLWAISPLHHSPRHDCAAPQRVSTTARARQSRHHLDLSAGTRQRPDRRDRARPTRADGPGRRLALPRNRRIARYSSSAVVATTMPWPTSVRRADDGRRPRGIAPHQLCPVVPVRTTRRGMASPGAQCSIPTHRVRGRGREFILPLARHASTDPRSRRRVCSIPIFHCRILIGQNRSLTHKERRDP